MRSYQVFQVSPPIMYWAGRRRNGRSVPSWGLPFRDEEGGGLAIMGSFVMAADLEASRCRRRCGRSRAGVAAAVGEAAAVGVVAASDVADGVVDGGLATSMPRFFAARSATTCRR